jgi:hypothetical protein
MSNTICLKPISALLKSHFYVPSYQRGYRWTEIEVKELLDDILQFINENLTSEKDVFYCLQPLIVYEEQTESNARFVLIDGQQRLTTIYLILTYLKTFLEALNKTKYSIEYETRTGSADFLDNIDEEKSKYNVDFYHIHQAYETIKSWFNDKDGNVRLSILQALTSDDSVGRNVKVIWYEIDPVEAIDIFTRINIGKIPLTNSELIKALFLQRNNFASAFELRQIQIATEWDLIEKRLQDDSFWYFITSTMNDNKYENRIEFIFDHVKNKRNEHEDLYTFHQFYQVFESDKRAGDIKIDKHWLEVKQYFSILEQWYSNVELYHYIGFLIEYKYSINTLIQQSKDLDKNEFLIFIKKEIKNSFSKIHIGDLEFLNHKKDIKKVLLLFNIETLLSTQKAIVRFPFDRYKKENWDIEHVNAQTDYYIDHRNYQKWASDLLDYFVGYDRYTEDYIDENETKTYKDSVDAACVLLPESLQKHVQSLCKILTNEGYDADAVTTLTDRLFKEFKEGVALENNGISNLALLDESTNRSYKNAMFPIKRKRIIENDRKGLFVPICTKNMFLKYYSRQLGEVMYWQQSDADNYYAALNETLSYYLPQNN